MKILSASSQKQNWITACKCYPEIKRLCLNPMGNLWQTIEQNTTWNSIHSLSAVSVNLVIIESLLDEKGKWIEFGLSYLYKSS